MAGVVDINILCYKILDNEILETLLNQYGVHVISIMSMKNWMWEDEQDIGGLNQIQEEMDRDRIVVIQLEKQWVKDLGLCIEKCNSEYLYNVWINTEGCEILDYDFITMKNRFFYEEIFMRTCEMEDKIIESIKLVGSGVETEFVYSEDVTSIIQNSRNMVFWIVKDTLIKDSVRSVYTEREMGSGMVALESVKLDIEEEKDLLDDIGDE